MAEKLYEGMFLLDSGQFSSNPEALTNKIIEIIEKVGAQVDAHRPWQDGKLAYAIGDHRKGLHYLTYFRGEGNCIEELNQLCKLSDVILRHMVIRHPESLYKAMVNALDSNFEAKQSSDQAEPEKSEKEETSQLEEDQTVVENSEVAVES